MKNKPHVWTAEEESFMREFVPGHYSSEIVEEHNRRFPDYPVNANQVKRWKHLRGVKCGLDCKFKKGQASYNKGMKGLKIPGSEKGWFKKGNVPHNHVPVGTEVMGTIGYMMVKIAEPNKWKLKHKLVWEEANGPVPKGCVLIFRDNDHTNCNLDNIILISKAENIELNRKGFSVVTNEMKDAAVLVTKSTITTRKKKNELKERQKVNDS